MRARRLHLLAAVAVVTTFAACTLNPQPLPPVDPEATPGGGFGPTTDASAVSADGGARGEDEGPFSDAAVGQDGSPPPEPEAGDDAG